MTRILQAKSNNHLDLRDATDELNKILAFRPEENLEILVKNGMIITSHSRQDCDLRLIKRSYNLQRERNDAGIG